MILDSRKRLRYRLRMKARRRSRRRRNPVGPLKGKPLLSGILTWLAIGAVGNAILVSVASSEKDPVKANANVRLIGTGLFIGQVAGSIAAYRAAKSP